MQVHSPRVHSAVLVRVSKAVLPALSRKLQLFIIAPNCIRSLETCQYRPFIAKTMKKLRLPQYRLIQRYPASPGLPRKRL